MYTFWDLSVFVGYFVVVVAIGFACGRRQQVSVDGYFRRNNQLPWYTIGLSIVAAGISSEQFVGEMGYAYKQGMPVANWEWLVFPALSILLWIFVPLYVRDRITTMPEYLEQRFGPSVRTLYAWLSVASYVFVNFALVFYTGGFALEAMWGINRLTAVWMMATLRDRWSGAVGWSLALAACVPVFGIAVWSPAVTAVLVAAAMLVFVGWPLACRSLPSTGMWDQSLLREDVSVRWWARVGVWWLILAAIFGCVYVWSW